VAAPRGRPPRQTAPLGTVVDHGSDAVFVTVQCAAGASLGLLPPLLPVLIAVAFIQYARGIYAPHPERWRGSGLGRWNGIGYFVVVGTLIAVRHALADDPTAEQLLYAFGWGLTASTAISIVERAARARHRG
jgi:hypothetical protein